MADRLAEIREGLSTLTYPEQITQLLSEIDRLRSETGLDPEDDHEHLLDDAAMTAITVACEVYDTAVSIIAEEIAVARGSHITSEEDVSDAVARLMHDGWVSVEERLPEPEVRIAGWGSVGELAPHHVHTCLLADGTWTTDSLWDITHWMPLPEGPTDD